MWHFSFLNSCHLQIRGIAFLPVVHKDKIQSFQTIFCVQLRNNFIRGIHNKLHLQNKQKAVRCTLRSTASTVKCSCFLQCCHQTPPGGWFFQQWQHYSGPFQCCRVWHPVVEPELSSLCCTHNGHPIRAPSGGYALTIAGPGSSLHTVIPHL